MENQLISKIAIGTGLAGYSIYKLISNIKKSNNQDAVVLIGDIGGTNARMSIYKIKFPERTAIQLKYKNYPSDVIESLDKVIDDFLQEYLFTKEYPKYCVLGVAGTCIDNNMDCPNLKHWGILNGDYFKQKYSFKFFSFINDFEAICFGLINVEQKDLLQLNDSSIKVQKGKSKATIGVGTGLGQGLIQKQRFGDQYDVYVSEGGHSEFSATSELQWKYYNFLKKKYKKNRVSCERAISGKFVQSLYEFLKVENPQIEKTKEKLLKKEILEPQDIFTNINDDELSKITFEEWAKMYGSQAGDLAVQSLCYSGLYLTGGVTHKLKNQLKNSNYFLDAFYNKGRLTNVLKQIPIFLVLCEDIGTKGALEYCIRLIEIQTTQ